MENKEIQEIINLYDSQKLDLAEKEVVKLIKTEPNNSILFNIFGAILTVFGLILPLHFFLNFEKIDEAAATDTCCETILCVIEKKKSLRVVRCPL